MSSNTSRMRDIFRIKTSRALDRMEDPREALDDSYDQQVRMLQQVRQGLAEVATARKRIELQGQEMGARYQRLAQQAQEALTQGREDLARKALERRSLLEGQVAALRDQHAMLERQQAQLQENERRLTERLEAFRVEKETMKASYTASQAQARANEVAAGISTQMNDAGASLNRAKDKIAQMQARASATEELLASGALNDLTAPADSDLERQLAAGAAKADVERQLQSMKDAAAAGSRDGAGSNPNDPDSWKSIGQGSSAP
ncbi:PspA/IM30 family protein [Leifsonia poae]|uniref:Phage shock protein A n=1 Tax=Leifsonia poae TaxID=110933 RepID=A0A9W6M0L0_9MICO|nr:PspA/IM30 family protein [Leifsonia poae]GLJ76847.1 phage shock protein A [Leifsonia poae]